MLEPQRNNTTFKKEKNYFSQLVLIKERFKKLTYGGSLSARNLPPLTTETKSCSDPKSKFVIALSATAD